MWTNYEPGIYKVYEVKWSEVAQSCLTLCDPVDCSPPCSSVHGIFQARVLEWVAISFSTGSSRPRDRTQVSCIVSKTLYRLSHLRLGGWNGRECLRMIKYWQILIQLSRRSNSMVKTGSKINNHKPMYIILETCISKMFEHFEQRNEIINSSVYQLNGIWVF